MALLFSFHATKEMAADAIVEAEVAAVVVANDIIEQYTESRLLLSYVDGRPIHVVAKAMHAGADELIITAYRPDPARWSADFRVRRPKGDRA